MSYTFTIVGKDKDDTKQLIAAKLAEIAKTQSCHTKDSVAAAANASAAIDLLENTDGFQIQVSMSGSLSWRTDVDGEPIAGVSISAHVHLVR